MDDKVKDGFLIAGCIGAVIAGIAGVISLWNAYGSMLTGMFRGRAN